jgi:alkaline phosphatase D
MTAAPLFFSEYAEGSSNNKYLEIYNPTPSAVSLDGYGFPSVSNGADVDGTHDYWQAFPAGALIGAGDVYVIAHPSADPSILDQSDHTHQYLSNGDDGYALVYGSESAYEVIDRIGDFGADPGDGWPVAGIADATKDHTLVRKLAVTAGNADWSASSGTTAADSEWIVLPQNTWDHLGSRGMSDPVVDSGSGGGSEGSGTGDVEPVTDAPLSNDVFAHGVASGDPYTDSVMLWTRYSPDASTYGGQSSIDVSWQVSADPSFSTIVDSGSFSTNAARDWTVKVEADGLQPGTDYYYRFNADGVMSPVGATNTLPVVADEIHLGVFSCANLVDASVDFSTYGKAVEMDQSRPFDAFIHVGDYIYENGDPAFEPTHELLVLDDYRTRYAQYHSNEDLLALRASNPLIAIWDDHEVSNDSWSTGANNHDPATDGDFIARRDQAIQAYYEWLPIREPQLREGNDAGDASTPLINAYRSFDFADIASLHMLETRLVARDQQVVENYDEPTPAPTAEQVGFRLNEIAADPATTAAYANAYGLAVPSDEASMASFTQALIPAVTVELAVIIATEALAEPTRNKIGADQLNWLSNQMAESSAAWQLLGSPTVMSPAHIPADLLIAFAGDPTDPANLSVLDKYAVPLGKIRQGQPLTAEEQGVLDAAIDLPYYLDNWDGYGAERERVLQAAAAVDKPFITISGDSHSSWSGYLNTAQGERVGVEISTPGVSSQSWFEANTASADAYLAAAHPALGGVGELFEAYVDNLERAELYKRGFLDLTLTHDEALARFAMLDPADQSWTTEYLRADRASLDLHVGLPESANLFFSEYAEGSYGNNKYLEIFNASQDVVYLDDYGFPSSSNGADGQYEFWNEFTPGATIAPGDVYVIAHPSAEQRILDQADQTHQFLSNGDDGVALAHGSASNYIILDRIGDFGADPGNGWTVAGLENATQNATLVRKATVSTSNPDWADSVGSNLLDSEWLILEPEAYLRRHGQASLGEHQPATLFFSEYAEGSSNNKYLEIYNPTTNAINLADYALANVSNAPTNAGEHEYWLDFSDGAEIAPGDVYVVAHGSADAAITDHADQFHRYLSNGDDGYALVKGTESSYEIVDFLGDFNGDPGSGWDVAGVSAATKDQTLVRKQGTLHGNSDWDASRGTTAADSEWVVLPNDAWLENHPAAGPGVANLASSAELAWPVNRQAVPRGYQDVVPTHDAQVVSGQPFDNFGSSNNLYVQSAAGGYWGNERSWLQFDLEERIPEDAALTSASLRLYLFRDDDTDLPVSLYQAENGWNETNLSWANQPQVAAEPLVSTTFNSGEDYLWVDFDVTDAVADAMAFDNTLSFMLKADQEDQDPWITYGLDSKEYSGNLAPRLRLEYDGQWTSDGGLKIIHFNDIHSRLQPHDFDFPALDDSYVGMEQAGGAAYLTTKVMELKAAHPHALVLDAGDMSEGGPLGDIRGNGGTIDFLELLDERLKSLGGRGIDALVVGNHDVRYRSYVDNLKDSPLPVISVNLTHDGTMDPYWDPYVIIDTEDGRKVGVLGYSTDDSTYLGPETEGMLDVKQTVWEDSNPNTVDLKDWVREIREDHDVDEVVLLSHVGHRRLNTGDEALLEDSGDVKLPEVVVSGHWHTMTDTAWQPSNLNYNTTNVEAASYTQYVGLLELSDAGKFVSAEKFPIRSGPGEIQPDQAVQALIDGLVREYDFGRATPGFHGFGDALSDASTAGLFFSEYAEGSSNNKYLEIYNPTTNAINLADYALANVSNAPTNAGEHEYWLDFSDGAEIAPGDVYVVAHGSADAAITDHADQFHRYLSNGDDGYALVKGTESSYEIVDFLGDFNGDPGSGWDVAGVSAATKDQTLVRKQGTLHGNSDWDASRGTTAADSEWTVLAQDAFVGSYGLEQVIGYSATDLSLDKDKWFTVSEFPWSGNNTAGFWTADSMVWKAQQLGYEADIAFQSGGGLRRSVAAGPITYREVFETYPWRDDTMVQVQMTGQEIWEFIQGNHSGASISDGWRVKANDGVVESVTLNGQPIAPDPNTTYNAIVSQYMYEHSEWIQDANDPYYKDHEADWLDKTPTTIDFSIRDAMVEYLAQFPDPANPMRIDADRYDLDTEFAGGFQAVVTMLADAENQPYHDAAFVRLLEATPQTRERADHYGLELILNEDGSINTDAQFAETMLYRSHLGFPDGVLQVGDIIEIWGEGGFYGGNPQFVDQNGIVAQGQEFMYRGFDPSLALPKLVDSISEIWNDHHENHLVLFKAVKIAEDRLRDADGFEIDVHNAGGYHDFTLPGEIGDELQITGTNTMRFDDRRFRVRDALVIEESPALALADLADSPLGDSIASLDLSADELAVFTPLELHRPVNLQANGFLLGSQDLVLTEAASQSEFVGLPGEQTLNLSAANLVRVSDPRGALTVTAGQSGELNLSSASDEILNLGFRGNRIAAGVGPDVFRLDGALQHDQTSRALDVISDFQPGLDSLFVHQSPGSVIAIDPASTADALREHGLLQGLRLEFTPDVRLSQGRINVISGATSLLRAGLSLDQTDAPIISAQVVVTGGSLPVLDLDRLNGIEVQHQAGGSTVVLRSSGGGALDPNQLRSVLGSLRLEGENNGTVELTAHDSEGRVATSTERPFTLVQPKARAVASSGVVELQQQNSSVGAAIAFSGTSLQPLKVEGTSAADAVEINEALVGRNSASGFGGADVLSAPSGGRVAGGADDDLLIGSATGFANLHGGSGDDVLIGGAHDMLSGSAGNDTFFPAGGAALMRGGPGADRYVLADRGFTAAPEASLVSDFSPGQDVLVFANGVGGGSVPQLRPNRDGVDVLLGQHHYATLLGVSAGEMDPSRDVQTIAPSLLADHQDVGQVRAFLQELA